MNDNGLDFDDVYLEIVDGYSSIKHGLSLSEFFGEITSLSHFPSGFNKLFKAYHAWGLRFNGPIVTEILQYPRKHLPSVWTAEVIDLMLCTQAVYPRSFKISETVCTKVQPLQRVDSPAGSLFPGETRDRAMQLLATKASEEAIIKSFVTTNRTMARNASRKTQTM